MQKMNSALFLQRELTRKPKKPQTNNNNMNNNNNNNMNMQQPSTTTDTLRAFGSMIASFMFFWAIIRQYFPPELRRFLERHVTKLTSFFNPYTSIYIHEYAGSRLRRSRIYSSVEAYLTKNSTKNAKRLKADLAGDGKKIIFSMEEYEKVTDEFRGAKIWWASGKSTSSSSTAQHRGTGFGYVEPEKRFYKLTFHNKFREMITESYLDHVFKTGKEITVMNRQRKLYTNGSQNKYSSHSVTSWSHIPFEHPATFDSIAMEREKKEDIIDDLLSFSESKEYYAQVGKAWKRGYLLYGPPGTGKSTMIAAMANLLHYDVYDLELTAVKDNTELRKLLIDTTSKSIIVIEDIDCSLDLTGQRKKKTDKKDDKKEFPKEDGSDTKVTLSGLLNFIDGLWSASGGERIIVFTTNHVEKLDPALIRRGRMDMHIELTYCSFEGFKVFAKNYLKIEEHAMFETIERLIGETNITPADVAENMMCKSKRENADRCLSNLVKALEDVKKKNAAEKKAKQELKLKELEKEISVTQDKQEIVEENENISCN